MNNAPARQFFMALTAGTPYTLLVHPNVTGNLSAKLANVTVPEALSRGGRSKKAVAYMAVKGLSVHQFVASLLHALPACKCQAERTSLAC